METVTQIGDNRKLFCLIHKATVTQSEGVSEMIRDINGVPIKAVKDRLRRRKEFFEAKHNYDAPSVVPNTIDLPIEPYFCNCEPPTEEEIAL
ncbi:unnamed protein product [Dracunculus medinensis]|uniref:Uncharacterized protein n=1 Tax=Dracunculus medinensis TaxID=318479 RepID=A0A0N4U921_DRAME|nr:unnamed protein product [Dracunculus medinensis]